MNKNSYKLCMTSSNNDEKETRKEIDCGKFTIILTDKKTKDINKNHMSPYVSPLYERLKSRKGKIPTPEKLIFSEDSEDADL